MKISLKHLQILSVAGSFFILVVFTGLWLKSSHDAAAPTQFATDFLDLLKRNEFDRAHEMTFKNGNVGTTVTELKAVSARQLCQITHSTGIFPTQSNGNRLRRWLRGAEVELPEIHVEFAGNCLLSVVLRRTNHGRWKVFNFESHAG